RQERNAKLRALPPRSLVLFGSRLADDFVLDTCFVVATGVDYDAHHLPARSDARMRSFVYDPLFADGAWRTTTFRSYQGATVERPIGAMFSFVPARPHGPGGEWGFARPAIRLPGLITPTLAQAAKVTPVDADRAERIWHQVVEQVLDADLVLATRLDAPVKRGSVHAGRA
ncbi:MAG: hypothetical protein ACYC1D_14725, partial [Acidimicrobiales bacterium]